MIERHTAERAARIGQMLIEASKRAGRDCPENPACRLIFRDGLIICNVDDIPGATRYGEERRKLGPLLSVRPVRTEDAEWVDSVFYGVLLAPHHPRRVRYDHREQLRRRLPRRAAPLLGRAKRQTQKRFLSELSASDRRAITKTGLDPVEFWRQVRRGPNDSAPLAPIKEQRELF